MKNHRPNILEGDFPNNKKSKYHEKGTILIYPNKKHGLNITTMGLSIKETFKDASLEFIVLKGKITQPYAGTLCALLANNNCIANNVICDLGKVTKNSTNLKWSFCSCLLRWN